MPPNGGVDPTQQCTPMARIEGSGRNPWEHRRETPPRGRHQDPEGDTQRYFRAREPDGGRMETRAPPKRLPAHNASGRVGREKVGGPPTQKRAPTACSGGTGVSP